MFQRAVVTVAGLAMAASVGLAGVGAASAASPAVLHIQAGSQWHDADASTSCGEVITFAANGTFTADQLGDSGTWSGGGTTLTMRWTAGGSAGASFNGTFTKTPVHEYLGKFGVNGAHLRGKIVKGAVAGC